MRPLLIFILLMVSTLSFAQGEANNWYFGEFAGLNFSNGTPTSINTGKLQTREGCSSFSDKDGNLLFYSDGTTVWNRIHNVMEGGSNLNGDSSSTQSAMIIPKPGSTTEYYIFTVGAKSSENSGFYYYTIDMSKNNTLGAVVDGPVDLNNGQARLWSEKVAAVKSTKCNAYWVVSFIEDVFVAYEVTSSGVSVTPVLSKVDYIAQDARGYLKISPNGERLAIAHTSNRLLVVFDFNAENGRVTNPIQLPLDDPADRPYGLEFSSSSELLYVHGSNDYFNNEEPEQNAIPENHKSILYQFDVSLPSTTEIIASKVILDDRIMFRGALQLGPDQKIYRSLATTYEIGTSYLGVIDAPNERGLAANYRHKAINLSPGIATQGLPPFIASIFSELEIRNSRISNQNITNQTINLCVGSSYTFNPEEVSGLASYSWKHNGSEINTSENLNLNNVNFDAAGTYELTVEVVDECGDVIIYEGKFTAEVYMPPTVNQNFTFEQCDIDADTTDGSTLFNFTDKDDEIKGSNTDYFVTYYESLADLDSNIPIQNSRSFTASTGTTIYFRLTDPESGCFDTGELALFVYPTSLDSYDDLFACENDVSENPLISEGNDTGNFDFETQRQRILNLFSLNQVNVGFYTSIEDAQTSLNPIEGFTDLTSQTIYVKISNSQSSDCISVGSFEVIVNEIPILAALSDPIMLCIDNPIGNPQPHTTPLDGTSDNPADTFQWFKNGALISGANSAVYDANDKGTYTVEASRNYPDGTICTGKTSYEVLTSNPAVLRYDDITIVDDSANNSITINPANLGLGDYEYALNNPEGPYQDSPFFEGIIAGHHFIYIRDKNGCGISQFEVSLLGFPKFFTPNNDGFNDTWNILGLSPNFYATSLVHIFDRYGKLVATINPFDESWDGVFNGEALPSSDYWYSVELTDNLGTVNTRKGHFSLIRR